MITKRMQNNLSDFDHY